MRGYIHIFEQACIDRRGALRGPGIRASIPRLIRKLFMFFKWRAA